MTAIEACNQIEEAINDLHIETREQRWEWCFTEEITDEAHVENHRQSLAATREHFAMGDAAASMWFVSTDTDATLALCGTSPTAKARARYIAWVNPENVRLLIDRVRELEAAR